MLKKIRILLATLSIIVLTLLFLDFTGWMRWASGLAKFQLVPAVLALNVVALVVILLVALVMGRFYCSVVCPLGILQDIVSSLRRKRNRFHYSPAKNWLRYTILVLYIIAFIAGVHIVVALLDPYSAYGRIVNTLFSPVYREGNNLLATAAEKLNSYAFFHVDIAPEVMITLLVAVVTLLVVVVLAWRGGRTYCNTICPVGSTLGLLSRFSLFKIRLNEDECISCGRCERNCKASAIDTVTHTVDYSRCVVCGNCIGKCHRKGITYSLPKKKVKKEKKVKQPQEHDAERRAFLVGAAVTTASIAMAQEKMKLDGGLAVIVDKQKPHRHTPVTPPGALSARNMAAHCTECQLCVSACPNGVLQPSTALQTLMQPSMNFEAGYCRPECVRCSTVCPTSAINKITTAEKTAIHIGHAVWVRKNCVPLTDGVPCGNCARHCPVQAISMIPIDPDDESSLRIPAIDESRCIGCGACEYLCPARPFTAIYVEGHESHRVD